MVDANISAEKRFFQKLDRILGNRYHLKVKLGDPKSDSKRKIWLPLKAESEKYDDYDEYLKNMKEHNYHELGHVLFTDACLDDCVEEFIEHLDDLSNFDVDNLSESVAVPNFINRLEDARVEQMMTDVFPAVSKYFEKVMYDIADPEMNSYGIIETNKLTFFDTYLRRFLDDDFRQIYAKEFYQEIVYDFDDPDRAFDKIRKYMDEYYKASDYKNRMRYAAKLFVLLDETSGSSYKWGPPESAPFGQGYKTRSLSRNRQKKLEKQQEQTVENDDLESMDGQEVENTDLDVESESGAEDRAEEGSARSSGESGEQSQMEQEQEDSSQKIDTDKFGGDIESEIEQEIEQDKRTIRTGGGWSPYKAPKKGGEHEMPAIDWIKQNKDDLVARKQQIKRTIRQLRAGLRPQYDRNQRSGKIDVRSVMQAQKNGSTRVFKKFKKDKRGKTRLATVLLLDRSGSMAIGPLQKTYGASWCISRALEETNNRVCELAYNTQCKTISDWRGKGRYRYTSSGGTNPAKALYVSSLKINDIHQLESELIPMVFLITDGVYNPGAVNFEGYSPEQEVKTIQQQGGKVAEIILQEMDEGSQFWKNRDEVFDYVETCPDLDELPSVLEKILVDVEQEFLKEERMMTM